MYVVSNFKGYLKVGVSDIGTWVRSPFSADKFEDKANAERNAALVGGVVVEIPDTY